MSLVRALLARFVRNKPRLQEEFDVRQLYHLLNCHLEGEESAAKDPKLKDISYYEQLQLVNTAVTQQLITKLRMLSETDLAHDNGNISFSNNQNLFSFHLSRCHPYKQENISGVFLNGYVTAGSLVCFYPGTVYLPTDLQHMPNFPDIGEVNPCLMSYSDGSVIDAMNFQPQDSRSQCLAEGHMVRHPPPGTEANVMPFSYNVSPSFPKELLPLIPNRYYKYPGLLYYSKSLMRTIVFVATREINNEELFLNYRLHPESQLPSWYTSVDEEEARRRWKY